MYNNIFKRPHLTACCCLPRVVAAIVAAQVVMNAREQILWRVCAQAGTRGSVGHKNDGSCLICLLIADLTGPSLAADTQQKQQLGNIIAKLEQRVRTMAAPRPASLGRVTTPSH